MPGEAELTERPKLDQDIIRLYDEYTHKPLDRRVFLSRLAVLAGGTAAATAILPLLENNYAQAAIVDPADARLETGYLTYNGASGPVRAYFAKAKSGPAKRPAIIVIHENRGLNPHLEDVARRAATEGFMTIAVDLLSQKGGTPASEDAARQVHTTIDAKLAVRDLVAAVDYLGTRPDVSGKIGAVGFCFGGGMANQLAVNAPKLDAAVAFYGPAPDVADVPKIKARVMLHYAGLDERINAGIAAYEAALKTANVTYVKHMYEGVNHAFHNDLAGDRYNKEAATLAWSRTMAFFKQNLVG